MPDFGCFLSGEEHSPAEIVDQARMAEQTGFDALRIADHYRPWVHGAAVTEALGRRVRFS
ncbi:hypothetical protein [Streptomyces umbrinus]